MLTRGFTAWAGDAQETKTTRHGSSPQVRCTCSGVPSVGAVLALPAKEARDDAAAARPATPASLKNPRRESETAGDSISIDGSGSVGGSAGGFCVNVYDRNAGYAKVAYLCQVEQCPGVCGADTGSGGMRRIAATLVGPLG